MIYLVLKLNIVFLVDLGYSVRWTGLCRYFVIFKPEDRNSYCKIFSV